MKTINIYLTKEQKKHADRLRAKYKVSLSTICGTAAYWLVYVLIQEDKQETIKQLQENYLNKQGNYKTSVKPREVLEVLGNEITSKNMFTTNALVIYLDHKINEYVNLEHVNKYYAEIDKKLNQSYEIHWDYNSFIRNQRRMIRQNKEYWKKAIEED